MKQNYMQEILNKYGRTGENRMKYNRQKFCDMTSEEKLDLIKRELDLKTHNATTKDGNRSDIDD